MLLCVCPSLHFHFFLQNPSQIHSSLAPSAALSTSPVASAPLRSLLPSNSNQGPRTRRRKRQSFFRLHGPQSSSASSIRSPGSSKQTAPGKLCNRLQLHVTDYRKPCISSVFCNRNTQPCNRLRTVHHLLQHALGLCSPCNRLPLTIIDYVLQPFSFP
ncbi:hypothetical protein LR48_Vigan09g115900 [Vigna angularis]|uniref:Uncharacterized protein n=1 Tax=Phaseolus angularis TaxID=3914 RepID=A0A0L9VBR6_PHAAN|nr:hypothetical protein LR48_Vigan09g115900 [Vigna angularis]